MVNVRKVYDRSSPGALSLLVVNVRKVYDRSSPGALSLGLLVKT